MGTSSRVSLCLTRRNQSKPDSRAAAAIGGVDWGESDKDKDDTTGSKVTSVSSSLPSELGAQSVRLANVPFINDCAARAVKLEGPDSARDRPPMNDAFATWAD